MERFSERENVLWGYTHQRSFENPSSSSETTLRNSDVDFHDVFGGPPRRSSVHEIRHSFIGAVGSEDAVPSRGSWSGMSEKPVFGEENSNRRPYQSGDFFDDIFRGDESYSSPRRADRDPSCSTPGSRVLSPARPLPPRTDPFGTSLPAQFSLPAKLTKSMDLPAFASSNRSPYKYKDGASNGIIYPYTPNASLSVFSSQAVDGQDELINDVRSSYRQSPLSNEFSLKNEKPSYMTKSNETDTGGYLKEDSKSPLSNEFSLKNEEPSYMTKSNETDMGGNLKEDSKSVEAPGNNSQFHFSIYKWAGRGVPLHVPLRAGLKSKEKVKLERCSTYNGRDENDSRVSELFTAIEHEADSLCLNDDISASTESKMERENHDKTKTDNRVETSQIVEEAALKKPESKSLDTVQCTVENILGGTILSDNIDGTKSYSIPETGLSEETDKTISMVTEEGRKPELKPLRSLLHDEIEGQGNGEGTKKTEGKENVVKMAKANVSASKNVKNLYGKRTNSNKAEINEASLQGKPINSGDNIKRSGVKGKVREFVKIFNQEASSMPKINVDPRSQSSRWKSTGINGTDYQTSVSTIGMDKKMHLPNVTKTAYASFTVDENVAQSKKQYSHVKTTMLESSDDASSFSESHPYGSKVTLGYLDDLFQEDFLVKELPHDHDKQPQNGEDYDAIQVLDAKIRQWSNGKKGNIRSLLSTLQYVLWPGSGWKPVPLVDIIEGSAVKRAYQKALLCLHPDKLQQKGATSHQKYIAEKVFGILQEAWNNFNSL